MIAVISVKVAEKELAVQFEKNRTEAEEARKSRQVLADSVEWEAEGEDEEPHAESVPVETKPGVDEVDEDQEGWCVEPKEEALSVLRHRQR